MYLNIVNGNKMYFIKYLLTVIIIQISWNGVNSDIPNCDFYNTRNISDLGANDTIPYQSLVSDYDYIKRNGTRVSVETHKRYCVCPEPCINFCDQNTIDIYENYPEMNLSFTLDITKKDGSYDEKQDVVKYFNRTIRDPCQGYILNTTLKPEDQWYIYEDGSLYLEYSNSMKNTSQYCLHLDTDYVNKTAYSVLFPSVCPDKNHYGFYNYFKDCGMMFSVMFFLLTIIAYYRTKRIQSCHGKCFIMYLINLTIQYSLLSFANLTKLDFGDITCIGIGYSIYFSTIGFLTWTCIISYHTSMSLCRIQEPGAFRQYLAWGLLVPILLTSLICWVQSLKIINDDMKPGIEPKMCSVRVDRWSAAFYYYIFHIIVLLISLILYVKVIRYIIDNERSAVNLTAKPKSTQKKRFFLYFRLFLFMGVIWFMEILSYFMEMALGAKGVFVRIIDLFNSFHGLYIFLTFVVKTRQQKPDQTQQTEHMLVDANYS